MRIGVVSDTHDNLPKIARAIELFCAEKVDFVLHAGDFVAPFSLTDFKKLPCDWRGVFGNNDGEKNGLSAASDGRITEGPLRLTLSGKKITVVHDINSINSQTEDANLVVFGHTHLVASLKYQNKLILNPGECGGWLTGKSTVAIVDLDNLSGMTFNL